MGNNDLTPKDILAIFKENGLFKNQYGTWKVENSKVNFNFNGKYQGKTIKNGKVV